MNVYTRIQVDDYEQVIKCVNEQVGLHAYIAVHNTQLGPAFGGCRMWHYASHEDALFDALRLSKAMTYKNCLANVSHGGGKCVISANSPTQPKTDALLEAVGEFVNELKGSYVIAEDVGITFEDMDCIAERTNYVVPAIGGDPSPFTAKGAVMGLQGSWAYLTGSLNLQGVRVSVQGAGAVGAFVIKDLIAAGAEVSFSEVNPDNIQKILDQYPNLTTVHADDIYSTPADIFVPCALSGSINEVSISKMKAAGIRLIAGCANNQLYTRRQDQELVDVGILFAPDIVNSAGGVVQLKGIKDDGTFEGALVDQALNTIPQTLVSIYHRSKKDNLPTERVARLMVEEKLEIY